MIPWWEDDECSVSMLQYLSRFPQEANHYFCPYFLLLPDCSSSMDSCVGNSAFCVLIYGWWHLAQKYSDSSVLCAALRWEMKQRYQNVYGWYDLIITFSFSWMKSFTWWARERKSSRSISSGIRRLQIKGIASLAILEWNKGMVPTQEKRQSASWATHVAELLFLIAGG